MIGGRQGQDRTSGPLHSRRSFIQRLGASALGVAGAVILSGCDEEDRFLVRMTQRNHYEPGSIVVPVGSTIVWKNHGRGVHTVTSDPELAANEYEPLLPDGAEPWNSGDITPGSTYARTFSVPGQYAYFDLRWEAEGMVGTIEVVG